MTVEQDWKFTELWNKYDHSKCLNVITARRFFEAGIKAGQEIEWHEYPKEKPKENTEYLVFVNGFLGVDSFRFVSGCWQSDYDSDEYTTNNVTHFSAIPAWLKPPAQENNASTGI